MIQFKPSVLLQGFLWLLLVYPWSTLCIVGDGLMTSFETEPKSLPWMWVKRYDGIGRKVELQELEDTARAHYEWLMAHEESARIKRTLLVAAMFEPDSLSVYLSTTPGKHQQNFLRQEAENKHVAPTWWNIAKNLKDGAGRESDYYHAEDAVYFQWESAHRDRVRNNKYPSGTIITVWGRFPNEASASRKALCSSSKFRVPNCQSVANTLGVSYNHYGQQTTSTEEEDEFNEINDGGSFDAELLAIGDAIELEEAVLEAASKASASPLATTAKHSSVLPSLAFSVEATQHSSAQPKPGATHHTSKAHITVSPSKASKATSHIVTPTPTTDTIMCQVCTPVPSTADNCTSLKDCVVKTAKASATVGSSPVHVGTVTGSELYTSVSNAIASLCPEPTQTTSYTACETGTVEFPVPYIAGDMIEEGSLVVSVELSAYNLTSIRNAMINVAATAAQSSANATNCYTVDFEASAPMKRSTAFSWLPWLRPRIEMPVEEEKVEETFCNMVEFASVNYFGPYWREAVHPSPTDWLDVHYSFQQQPGGDFLCDLLYEADAALAVVAPEFAVGEVQLGDAIGVLCSSDPPER